VAEGAAVSLSPRTVDTPCRADVCVAAVLDDALHRVAVLGGREGMARSLGSVYGGAVTRFLGGGCRGIARRVIDAHDVLSWSNGLAVSRDGCTLLVSDADGGTHSVCEVCVVDGSRRRVVGERGDGPLQFDRPYQVWVASDGFVFVAEYSNERVQVLTPSLEFHGFVGGCQLSRPCGVCANADVVVVSEIGASRISVFSRGDGALVRRFGSRGNCDGQLLGPYGLCLLSDNRHVAVADFNNRRVSVFSLDGDFVRHVGVGTLKDPIGVACTADDELVVADCSNACLVVLNLSGEVLMTTGSSGSGVAGVAVHGGTIFAQHRSPECVVLQ
jgi:DNA-binding beta-propeller fold protein YncE